MGRQPHYDAVDIVINATMGALAAGGVVLAGWAIYEAVDDDYEAVQVCATTYTPEPIRVEDRLCETPATPAEAAGHGWYSIQIPDGEDVVIVNYGQPVHPPNTRQIGSFAPPRVSSPSKIVRAPVPVAGQPSTITRGGLGGGYGASSGS